jgi:Tol biopolymer transport system component
MRTAAAALLVAAAAACGDRVTGPPAAQQDQLLFLKHQPDNNPYGAPTYLRKTDIWRINADGTGAVNLTDHPAIYAGVNLSPDGRTLAFHSDRESPTLSTHIWLMATDGTNLRRFTPQGSTFAPRWSPDGTRIAYQKNDPDGSVVYVAPVSGGAHSDVSSAAIAADAPCPTGVKTRLELIGWTPGGSLLFSNYICGEGYRHYIVNGDGSNPRRYEFDPFRTFWSPDGSRVGLTQSSPERVMIAGADGSGMRELTDQSGTLALPRRVLPLVSTDYSPWSPDGSQLVVERWSNGGTQFELAAIRADGSGMRGLTSTPATFNGWSASGDKVAFTRFAAGAYNVFVVNADGTGLLDLTAGAGDATNAIWLPRR